MCFIKTFPKKTNASTVTNSVLFVCTKVLPCQVRWHSLEHRQAGLSLEEILSMERTGVSKEHHGSGVLSFISHNKKAKYSR